MVYLVRSSAFGLAEFILPFVLEEDVVARPDISPRQTLVNLAFNNNIEGIDWWLAHFDIDLESCKKMKCWRDCVLRAMRELFANGLLIIT